MKIYFLFGILLLLPSCREANDANITYLDKKEGFYLTIKDDGWWVGCDDMPVSMKVTQNAKTYFYDKENKEGYIIEDNENIMKFSFSRGDENGNRDKITIFPFKRSSCN